MRLKRLEMIGFKSFAQRTIVELTPGITAVVGPNGCGKSNIVDALRWAMGEQSARHLRGHLMEDVVFNGSESLPATGMAEVSLTFDNEDGRGPVEYDNFSEIMVTRRLFRSGESEYAINKTPCRLKDVIELFLGTGVGNKAYSIVEQGRVDEMVNAKPEERRALIEEAAGTSKYKSRKLVAERKLERTQQNLLRVSDIVREIERQIRSMELQAKKAERYRTLKTDLKEKDLAWAAVQRNVLDHDVSLQEEKLRDVENRLTQHVASLRSMEAESETVRLTLLDTEKEIGTQQENVYQLKVQIQAEDQRIGFYKKDFAELERTKAETSSELLQLEEKLRTLTREIEELKKAKESFVQLSLFEETFLQQKEEELGKLQLQIRTAQSEMDGEREALIDVANQISYLKNDILARERRREEITREITRNDEERAVAVASLEQSKEKRGQAHKDLESSRTQAGNRQIEANEVFATIQKLGQSKAEQEKKADALKEQLQVNRSRLVSLEDLQKNYEGYQEGVRSIMLKRQQEPASNGIYGLVAEVIEAPEDYEKALTAVLGDRLQYVIVKGHEEGVEAIEYLKRESSGRGSFLPLGLSRKERRPLPLGEAEVLAPLLEMISVREGYREVAEYLLSDVVVVRDLRAGLDLWHRNGFISTLVTPDGEVIDATGVVTGGSQNSLEGSFLSQRRRMKELSALVAELENQLKDIEREVEGLREQLSRAEARKTALGGEIHRLEIERVRIEHEHLSADQATERLEQALLALAQERSDLDETLGRLEAEVQACQTAIESRSHEKTERENGLADKQALLSRLTTEADRLESQVTESRIRNAALGEKREHADLNLENRIRLSQETSDQSRSRENQIAEIARRQSESEEARMATESSLEQGRRKLQELEARLEAKRGEYRDISRHVSEIEETIKELRLLEDADQEEKNRLQLLLAEKRLKLQHLADNIREKYDVDLKEIGTPASGQEIPTEDLLAEIEELRGRLERMGEVNLAAIGEFEELTTRFQFMNQQKDDLEKSIADLQRTIVKLNRVCRLRFKEAFEEINQKFEDIFPRLFRGGKAKLVLTDENDYLETGVDIIVQPPGKKLQSITLLSGGEKALTAVSLLFAIFLTKPSPFCFLDEVDAPLDDANLDRFNELIKEMSQISQFILITHNKRTMQAAEVLYGITMAEPGVSKVVSVKMS